MMILYCNTFQQKIPFMTKLYNNYTIYDLFFEIEKNQ